MEFEQFEHGDRVYHRLLKAWGEFLDVDDLDPTTATVAFDDDELGDRRISRSSLQRSEDE